MSDDQAAALPAAGQSTPAERTDHRTPDASGTTYTVSEAAEVYDVSVATLRRRLATGELTGAHKRPGPKGEEWAIPAAALDALGYRHRASSPQPAPTPAEPPAGEVLDALTRLTELLDRERLALQAAEADRADARAEAARLAAELDAERARRADALEAAERIREAELAAERTRAEEATRAAQEAKARADQAAAELAELRTEAERLRGQRRWRFRRADRT